MSKVKGFRVHTLLSWEKTLAPLSGILWEYARSPNISWTLFRVFFVLFCRVEKKTLLYVYGEKRLCPR